MISDSVEYLHGVIAGLAQEHVKTCALLVSEACRMAEDVSGEVEGGFGHRFVVHVPGDGGVEFGASVVGWSGLEGHLVDDWIAW